MYILKTLTKQNKKKTVTIIEFKFYTTRKFQSNLKNIYQKTTTQQKTLKILVFTFIYIKIYKVYFIYIYFFNILIAIIFMHILYIAFQYIQGSLINI